MRFRWDVSGSTAFDTNEVPLTDESICVRISVNAHNMIVPI